MAQVRTRKRGKTYSYIFEAGQVNGKRKVIEKGGFASKDEAYEAGVAAYTDWKHGNIGITSEKITLKDFMNHYMENVVKLNVKTTSYDLYTRIIARHITPLLGNLNVQDITPAILDKFIRSNATTGLSYSYLKQIKRLIHQTLDYAVYPAELITSNPANYIKIPKSAPRNLIKRTIVSSELYKKIITDYNFGNVFHIPIVLLYHTGMRVGEVLGLCWEDIDFTDKPCIHVLRQYSYISKAGNFLLPPKTATSVRDIFIDNKLAVTLKHWKKQCHENEISYGDSYCVVQENTNHAITWCSKQLADANQQRRHFVCINKNGRPLSRAALMHVLEEYGLNSHSFRHTHATILAEQGAPLKGIAGRLGHKRIEITEEVYTHSTQKMQEDVANIFEKMQTK